TGTVCVLLAGRHAGKRVVLLGALPSGLLLVTKPFAFNSCPLRRIPQRYVIGTSTKLDLGAFQLPAHLDDAYFKKNKRSTKRSVKRKQGEDIFATKKEVTSSYRLGFHCFHKKNMKFRKKRKQATLLPQRLV
ncbi:60S ribosomal protein L6-like, partial [Ostrinia furnacalis]|uniref:60S ribosomal protein L6-like n=1 Tax=Ostrinia furnacalis TaxID=93504 RepID=UPI00103A3BB3